MIPNYANTQKHKKKWFKVTNPDALLSRRDALDLIMRNADKAGVFEDLPDEQICAELPEAWRREHDQLDLFRNAPPDSANDERCNVWRWFLLDS